MPTLRVGRSQTWSKNGTTDAADCDGAHPGRILISNSVVVFQVNTDLFALISRNALFVAPSTRPGCKTPAGAATPIVWPPSSTGIDSNRRQEVNDDSGRVRRC